jgi:hypothetical protein
MSKLMKPLFVNGNFNRENKRIRANFLKTIGNYSIWIGDGEPDNDYAKEENDKYYFYIQKEEWLIPIGLTEYNLEHRVAEELLTKEWYGDFEKREKYFNEHFYQKTLPYEEKYELVREQTKKEEQFVLEHLKDETIQIEYLQNYIINPAIAQYVDTRDNGGKFPNFVGAAFLGDLDKCNELAILRHKKQEEEHRIRQEQAREERERKAAEKAIKDKKQMEEAENIFKNGGKIISGEVIIKLADKYSMDIPIRTRGWILNDLAEATITEDGGVSYRYYKRKKGSTGSQKAFDVLHRLCSLARIG